jgi:PhzF family phenazine biosynthesis protein
MVATGLPHLMLPVANAETVGRAMPNAALLAPLLEELGTDGVYVFAVTGDGSADARMFAPSAGIAEDPATGSAAGPLGAYLSHHGRLPSGHLTVTQGVGMGRPSTLRVDVEPDGDDLAVYVAGGVVFVGTGEFELPF